MLAFSVDNLLFFLLIAVAALFQVLSKAVSKTNKNEPDGTSKSPRPERPTPIRRTPTESDADRVRKFLEALGRPPSSTAPPPVASRTHIPPRRLAPVQPPPVLTRRWVLPREQQQKADVAKRPSPPPEQPSRVQEIVPPAPALAVPEFEVHEALTADAQPATLQQSAERYATPKAFNVATTLASNSGLREAIILREIFGPPRGLQQDIST